MVVSWINCVDYETVDGGSDVLTQPALSHITSSSSGAGEDDVKTEAVERRFIETQLSTDVDRDAVNCTLIDAF